MVLPVPFKRVLNYVKKNQKPSIISTLPNESVLAADGDGEILDKAAKVAEEIQDVKNTRKYKILTETLNINEKEALDFVEKSPNLTFGNLSESEIPKAIDNAWVQLKSINEDIALSLLQYETSGYGRTELFLNYAFDDINVDDSKIGGFGDSFDVKAGNNKYEVKSYNKLTDIRLGNEGNVTSYHDYNVMFSIFSIIDKFIKLNKDQMNALLRMLDIKDSKKQYSVEEIKAQVLTAKETTDENNELKTLSDCFKEGSISASNLQLLDRPIKYFGEMVDLLHKKKFKYMKIINEDTIYPITSIDDSDLNNIKVRVSGKLTEEEDNYIINTAHELFMLMKSVDLIDSKGNFNSEMSYKDIMLENISKKISDKFSNHPMLVIKSFKKDGKKEPIITDNICFGVFKKLKVNRITQGKIKVEPIN